MLVPTADRQAAATLTTRSSIAVNIALMILQIGVGVLAQSQALIVDGAHAASDLLADGVVLTASHRAAMRPDADHNYGHSRYETVASFFLGALLLSVGIGALVRAAERLAHIGEAPPVHVAALIVALIAIVAKEVLFRHMLRTAERVRSSLLIANAWHARSDAASSLVVSIGIAGSLLGFKILDPIAAAVVGVMIARMGWVFAWNAVQDLSDRALDTAAAREMREIIQATPGVRDVHELRTRKMGDMALVDAHILVDPVISVSEGHYIAETVRRRLCEDVRVLDALIHVDPENDEATPAPAGLPSRQELLTQVRSEFAKVGLEVESINAHYLSRGLELDVVVAPTRTVESTGMRRGRAWDENERGNAVPELSGVTDLPAMARTLGVRQLRLLKSAV
ncbi:MAG: cation diffusion facilitator family transporter [Janthinobacterium lividum]